MPPKRPERAQKSVQQEGRILLTIKAIQNGRFTSVAAATRSFEVPRTTLGARIQGRTNQSDSRSALHKFTRLEQDSIQDWLVSMDQRGAALKTSM